jgi:hypothetical protein
MEFNFTEIVATRILIHNRNALLATSQAHPCRASSPQKRQAQRWSSWDVATQKERYHPLEEDPYWDQTRQVVRTGRANLPKHVNIHWHRTHQNRQKESQ